MRAKSLHFLTLTPDGSGQLHGLGHLALGKEPVVLTGLEDLSPGLCICIVLVTS